MPNGGPANPPRPRARKASLAPPYKRSPTGPQNPPPKPCGAGPRRSPRGGGTHDAKWATYVLNLVHAIFYLQQVDLHLDSDTYNVGATSV